MTPTVDLRVGYACNQRCRFCDQGTLRDRVADAPAGAIRAILDAHPRGAIWLAGGEVTLRADLPALVRAARAAGHPRVGVQSNGRVLAAPGAATSLRAAGLTDVQVAIHGPDVSIHDGLTRTEGSWRLAVASVRRSKDAGLQVRLVTVITRSNVDLLPDLARLAIRLGVSGHRWILVRHEGVAAGPGPALSPPLERVEPPLQAALQLELDARIEGETVGIPLCRLGPWKSLAADRLDTPPVVRLTALPEPEPPRARAWAPGCSACELRAACPGIEPWRLVHFGSGEVRAPSPPVGELSHVGVQAACTLDCPGCPIGGGRGETETSRRLKQRLVRALGLGARRIRLGGGSPWEHPAVPGLVRELIRFGVSVEVRGPLHGLHGVENGVIERLAGATVLAVPVPDLNSRVTGAEDRARRVGERLAAAGVVVVAAPPEPEPAWLDGAGARVPCDRLTEG